MNFLGLYDEKNVETEGAVSALAVWARQRGYESRFIDASSLSISPCLGCFACWVKTPGVCVIADEGRTLVEALMPADLFVLITSIPFGSYAPAIKRALDRSIPILLPFFTVHEGEMHHLQRSRRRRRVLHVPYGEYGIEDLATFSGLARSHCDNLLSPRAKHQFEYEENPEALVAWVDEEVEI
ncbi:MAG: NAD(P)H-dependent oxidoreductase [Spirochaetota bacterium]